MPTWAHTGQGRPTFPSCRALNRRSARCRPASGVVGARSRCWPSASPWKLIDRTLDTQSILQQWKHWPCRSAVKQPAASRSPKRAVRIRLPPLSRGGAEDELAIIQLIARATGDTGQLQAPVTQSLSPGPHDTVRLEAMSMRDRRTVAGRRCSSLSAAGISEASLQA
jgi:hypothetical protein